MFCPNCGTKLEGGEAFCPNCGERLEIQTEEATYQGENNFDEDRTVQLNDSVPYPGEPDDDEDRTVSPKKKPVGHKGKQTKIIVGTVAGVLVVAAAAGAALYFTGNKTIDIDLKPFFTITVDGYEGDGHVELKFDAQKFEDQYQDKLSIDSKKLEKWVKNAGEDSLYAKVEREQNEEKDVEILGGILGNLYYQLSPEEDVSNGDVIKVETNAQLTEFLESIYHCKFEDIEDYTVDGLAVIEEYDPFAELQISFTGTEPQGTVEIVKPTDEIGQYLDYEITDNGTFSNGDTVQIKVADETSTIEEKFGKRLSSTSKDVTVEGLGGYVKAASQIPEECIEKLTAQASDDLQARAANEWNQNATLLGTEYIGNYFLHAKSQDRSDYQNMLYLCFRVDVENYQETSSVLYDEVNSYYTYYQFHDLIVDGDGRVTVDPMNYTTVSEEYEVNLPGEGSASWIYKGYKDLDTMYHQCVAVNASEYEHEEAVKDKEYAYEPTRLTEIPKDAKEYNGNYYYLVDVPVSWEEAEARCEKKGGHLATVTSAEENTWIAQNINPYEDHQSWLGGLMDVNHKWHWITGEDWSYTSFGENQPDFYDSNEYYLCTLHSGDKWNDGDLEGYLGNSWISIEGYIIEWEGDPQTKEAYAQSVVDEKEAIKNTVKSEEKTTAAADQAGADAAGTQANGKTASDGNASASTGAKAASAEDENRGTALQSSFYKDGNITGTSKDYVIPDSMTRYLTYDDISMLNAKGLSYARNEMMARMGRGFKNQELADYFNSMPWYQNTISPEVFDQGTLPDVVQKNASLMLTEEKKMGMYIE